MQTKTVEIKSTATKARVIFQPSGRRGEVAIGKSLLDAGRELGAEIETVCGQKQMCGKCKVRIDEGYFKKEKITSSMANVTPFTSGEEKFVTPEERAQGFRLGCRAIIQGDLLVYVPEQSRTGKQVVRKAARDIEIKLNPMVKKYHITMPEPSLQDPLGDFERIGKVLAEAYRVDVRTVDSAVLREMSPAIRAGNWEATVTVWNDSEITRVEPGVAKHFLGVAVDVGTTTVAAYLCDLNTGKLVATESTMNPQVPYGEDVMARIAYAMQHEYGLAKMNQAILETLDELAETAARSVGATARDISEMTIVGNTCMHHLLLHLDPGQLGLAPFPPVIHQSTDIKARDFGLRKLHPGMNVHILPNEAGFVGADNVGVLIAEKPYNQDQTMLVIDIGTNGELLLGNRDRMISCSCATGPALEGAQIKFGMRAAAGAIERIKIDPQAYDVNYQVIGRQTKTTGGAPTPGRAREIKGICGSGIVDAIAELFRTGVIDQRGTFRKDLRTPRVRRDEQGMMEFVLAWSDETALGQDVTITQSDVRAVQLAKAAIYAGAKVMMGRLGVAKLDQVVLAGAFGSYIDKEKARLIGLFPDCEPETCYTVGNAAGDGARMALIDKDQRIEANHRARWVEYIELTLDRNFEQEFIDATHLPHRKDSFPSLQELLAQILVSSSADPGR